MERDFRVPYVSVAFRFERKRPDVGISLPQARNSNPERKNRYMSEEKKGFFRRLVDGLSKTRSSIVDGFDSIFAGYSSIDDDFYDELEETLIEADMGYETTERVIEDLKKQVDRLAQDRGENLATMDVRKTMEGTIDAMSGAMQALCIGIAAITILVVIFVEALIIRAKIIREWRGMGISKAMGMTSRGLIAQIMLSNIPAVAIGALIGALLSQAAGSAAIKAAFSLFVIKNVNFDIAPLKMAICFAGIIVTAIAAAAAAGLKVRKLKPVEMITEE